MPATVNVSTTDKSIGNDKDYARETKQEPSHHDYTGNQTGRGKPNNCVTMTTWENRTWKTHTGNQTNDNHDYAKN